MAAVAAALVIAAGAGCARPAGERAATSDLTILAAASLDRPLVPLLEVYEEERPGVEIDTSTGSSTALRIQIEQGAPADVYLPADPANAAALVDAGLAAAAPIPFAASRLVVIVPADNPAGVRTPADLARRGVAVIAAGEGVPISTYALEAVARMEGLEGYPPGFRRSYEANIVSREEDVRGVVTRVALGEGDAAIVYATHVVEAEDVEAIPIPGAANVRPLYSAVVLRRARQPETARAFAEWLAGPRAWPVLEAFGFDRPT